VKEAKVKVAFNNMIATQCLALYVIIVKRLLKLKEFEILNSSISLASIVSTESVSLKVKRSRCGDLDSP
jgi:hypothetical protein